MKAAARAGKTAHDVVPSGPQKESIKQETRISGGMGAKPSGGQELGDVRLATIIVVYLVGVHASVSAAPAGRNALLAGGAVDPTVVSAVNPPLIHRGHRQPECPNSTCPSVQTPSGYAQGGKLLPGEVNTECLLFIILVTLILFYFPRAER